MIESSTAFRRLLTLLVFLLLILGLAPPALADDPEPQRPSSAPT